MLPGATKLHGATLRVHDLDRVRSFYEQTLGLTVSNPSNTALVLEPPGGDAQIRLEHAPNAPQRPHGSEGLFHIALLVPTREHLACILQRFKTKGTPLQGAADHAVSEAIYLQDPEGNGLEIYRDRPKHAWPRRGNEVAMVTEPLDEEDLLDLADEGDKLPSGTTLGHIHLQTLNLEKATWFYTDLGLQVTQSTFPGARFLAAGDYHHHIGLNRWNVTRPHQPDATGLASIEWSLPPGTLKVLEPHVPTDPPSSQDSACVHDPIGIEHRFTEQSR